jgi:hypothetical protein
MSQTFSVKLRRWHEPLRGHVYKFVDITDHDARSAGINAERQHAGWTYVEVWNQRPPDLTPGQVKGMELVSNGGGV